MHYELYFFSELKRRLKAEHKAKEKLKKEAAAQKQKQPVIKKETDTSAATKSADISPNV